MGNSEGKSYIYEMCPFCDEEVCQQSDDIKPICCPICGNSLFPCNYCPSRWDENDKWVDDHKCTWNVETKSCQHFTRKPTRKIAIYGKSGKHAKYWIHLYEDGSTPNVYKVHRKHFESELITGTEKEDKAILCNLNSLMLVLLGREKSNSTSATASTPSSVVMEEVSLQ